MKPLLIQNITNLKREVSERKSLSSRLCSIVTAPKDFDYKEKLANRHDFSA